MKAAVLYSSILALAALGFNSSAGQEITVKAESDFVPTPTPFVLTNGYICQPMDTAAINGVRAAYTFTITNSGSYVIQALVNALGVMVLTPHILLYLQENRLNG